MSIDTSFDLLFLTFTYSSFKTEDNQLINRRGLSQNSKCGRFFHFSFTLKSLMTTTFPDENKCPSYKGACLVKAIFNKNPPLTH